MPTTTTKKAVKAATKRTTATPAPKPVEETKPPAAETETTEATQADDTTVETVAEEPAAAEPDVKRPLTAIERQKKYHARRGSGVPRGSSKQENDANS